MTDAELAAIALAVYRDKPAFELGDVRASLTMDGDQPIIAWRGTDPDSFRDWLRDLDGLPETHLELGICHRGFLTAAIASLSWVTSTVKAHGSVILVGHSLGAAIAALTAAILVTSSSIQVPRVVTFGCPRVGLWGVRRALKGVACARYVHGNDIVPDVPSFFEHHCEAVIKLRTGGRFDDPIVNHGMALYQAAVVSALSITTSPTSTG